MSAPTVVSEREARLRERAAWVACDMEFVADEDREAGRRNSELEAARRYPLPTVERPRVVRDPGSPTVRYSMNGTTIHAEEAGLDGWYGLSWGHSAYVATAQRVALWHDLFQRPTELVEDES